MAQAHSEKKINLALQGGGSHGAFTWGIIERLLEEDDIQIDGICGTSAGAMNAVVTTYGMLKGGKQGALDLLNKFWQEISKAQAFTMLQPSWVDKMMNNGSLNFSPAYYFLDFFTLVFSPYQFNPLNINPLRSILEKHIDFDELHQAKKNLFVCATNVRTSRVKVFHCQEVSVEAVLASACLPFLFQTIEIDGESYWDGGYMGNPPLFPLIDHTNTPDIMLVQLNPIHKEEVPKTVEGIRDRINEIGFNSSLMWEMRKINFVEKLLDEGLNLDGRLKRLYIHHINTEKVICQLGVSSKLNADWGFLQYLRNKGRETAEKWLEEHKQFIGVKSTCDIAKTFL
jgi:NTE family protein